MLASWVRSFATKRTVPYVTKNNWTLPAVLNPSIPENNGTLPPQPLKAGKEWGSLATASSTPETTVINVPKDWRRLKTLPQWKKQMFALKEKFPEGWNPKRKLSREEMDRLREIKRARPQLSLNALGDMFRISPEAVRRIVKSRWRPDPVKEAPKLQERWHRRGERLGSWTTKQKPGVKRKIRTTKLHDPAQDFF